MPPGAVDWTSLLAVREPASRALEALRESGAIGSSLDATLTIYADGELRSQLDQLGDELRFLFITSAATVRSAAEHPPDALAGTLATALPGGEFWVVAAPAAEAKCVRCWHHRANTGSVSAHPHLCSRCVSNVAGSGETRCFV